MQPSLEHVEETLQKGDLHVPCVNHCYLRKEIKCRVTEWRLTTTHLSQIMQKLSGFEDRMGNFFGRNILSQRRNKRWNKRHDSRGKDVFLRGDLERCQWFERCQNPRGLQKNYSTDTGHAPASYKCSEKQGREVDNGKPTSAKFEDKSGERTGKDSSYDHKRWLTQKPIINNEFFYIGNILADFKAALAS